MRISIYKARLSKKGGLEAGYHDEEGNDITLKGINPVHSDLKAALSNLVPYFADITEQKEADSIDWSDPGSEENLKLLRRIDVTGVSYSTDEISPMVTMTGKRILSSSKVLNLNSPGIEIGCDTMEWAHISEFDIAVQAFFYEVEEYILNRKWEVIQTCIDFDNPEDPFAEATPTDGIPIENTEDIA